MADQGKTIADKLVDAVKDAADKLEDAAEMVVNVVTGDVDHLSRASAATLERSAEGSSGVGEGWAVLAPPGGAAPQPSRRASRRVGERPVRVAVDVAGDAQDVGAEADVRPKVRRDPRAARQRASNDAAQSRRR